MTVHGVFQARVLEWVAISFSRGSSQPRNQTWVSCIAGRCCTIWATGKCYTWYIRPIKGECEISLISEQIRWGWESKSSEHGCLRLNPAPSVSCSPNWFWGNTGSRDWRQGLQKDGVKCVEGREWGYGCQKKREMMHKQHWIHSSSSISPCCWPLGLTTPLHLH